MNTRVKHGDAQIGMLPVQLTIDEYAAEIAKQDALSRVEQNADLDWKQTALEVVKQCALRSPQLTADDIWSELANIAIGTHENRALGPVMNAAQRAGYITPTNEFVKCKRVSRHHTDIRVWKSNLYQGA